MDYIRNVTAIGTRFATKGEAFPRVESANGSKLTGKQPPGTPTVKPPEAATPPDLCSSNRFVGNKVLMLWQMADRYGHSFFGNSVSATRRAKPRRVGAGRQSPPLRPRACALSRRKRERKMGERKMKCKTGVRTPDAYATTAGSKKRKFMTPHSRPYKNCRTKIPMLWVRPDKTGQKRTTSGRNRPKSGQTGQNLPCPYWFVLAL